MKDAETINITATSPLKNETDIYVSFDTMSPASKVRAHSKVHLYCKVYVYTTTK